MNVCLYCCSLYLVCVLIVVIMGRGSEFSACVVCQVVQLMSCGMAVCSVVCGTLVGVPVFSIMRSELLIISEIS